MSMHTKLNTIIWNLIYKFSATPIKILTISFMVLTKLILKCAWKNEGPRGANTILKEIKEGELAPLDIRLA